MCEISTDLEHVLGVRSNLYIWILVIGPTQTLSRQVKVLGSSTIIVIPKINYNIIFIALLSYNIMYTYEFV